VGTADGHLWIGLGGDKGLSIKKTRKWGGLREDMSLSKKIADGPIVALCVARSWHFTPQFECTNILYPYVLSAFLDPSSIITSTLLGSISRHTLSTKGNAEDWTIESVAVAQARFIAKANALAVHGDNVVVGGFRADGKGTVEVYRHETV
jgi:hypothetical protein